MKRKWFFVILFLVLAIFVSGCSGGGIITPATGENQKEEIKAIVTNYWLALSNREYELAKTYCVPNGKAYQAVEEYQSMPYLESSTLTWTPYFNSIIITGNNANVNMDITLIVTVCFENICSDASETLRNFFMYLTITNGIWKLK